VTLVDAVKQHTLLFQKLAAFRSGKKVVEFHRTLTNNLFHKP
jgi:hypothetical protein